MVETEIGSGIGSNTAASTKIDKRLRNLRPPWKPGQSGNPAGRPSIKPLRAIMREHAMLKRKDGTEVRDKYSYEYRYWQRIRRWADEGREWANIMLANYFYGKPPQAVDVTSGGDRLGGSLFGRPETPLYDSGDSRSPKVREGE